MVLRCENVSDGLLHATVSTHDLVISSRVPSQMLVLLDEFGGSIGLCKKEQKKILREGNNAVAGKQMSN